MKTIFLLMMLSFALTTHANDDNAALNQSLSKRVQSTLIMPDALKQESKAQKITIYFSVDDYGNVVEVNAKTANREAKRDLEKQFMQLNFKGLQSCVYNSIDVNFVVH